MQVRIQLIHRATAFVFIIKMVYAMLLFERARPESKRSTTTSVKSASGNSVALDKGSSIVKG